MLVSKPARVHLGGRRGEHQVDPLSTELIEVAVHVAWVGGQVLVLGKLGRIDEYAGRGNGIVRAGAPHQRQVPLVEKTHGGNEPKRAWAGALDGPEVGDGLDYLHVKPRMLNWSRWQRPL